MNEEIYYKIGDIVLKIISDLPYPLPDGNAADFRIEHGNPDYTYIFKKVDNITNYTGKLHFINNVGYAHDLRNEENTYCRGFLWRESVYDTVLKMEKKQGTIYYLSSQILAERYQNGFNFFNYFCAERIFTHFKSIVLHSSHVNVEGKGVLFSASSGTGKSTQASLWERYAGGIVINGDRTLIRKRNNEWNAYGCPMCGTSGIHLQGNEAIHSIIMLEQGTKNILRQLNAREAFSQLYAQTTIQNWDSQMVYQSLECLESIVSQIPVWKYSCTKTRDAVDILKRELNL